MLNKNIKILVIGSEENRFLTINSKYHVDYQVEYKKISRIGRGIRRFWHIGHIPLFSDVFLNLNKKELNKYDLILLYECLYSFDVIQFIRTYNKHCRLILWLWNSVKGFTITPLYDAHKIFHKIITRCNIKKYNYEIWSFDHIDCEKFKLQYNNQYCAKYDDLNLRDIKYDVLFQGLDKGRLPIIKELFKQFKTLGISCNLKVVPDKRKIYPKDEYHFLIKQPLPYHDFVQKELQSRCFLEIVQKGQTDVTWRAVEAQFYERKLITNCPHIKNYDFYDPRNIFILGVDSFTDLKKFIEIPYNKLDSNIMNKYQFDGWIENFFLINE